jgi:hypothetical protein
LNLHKNSAFFMSHYEILNVNAQKAPFQTFNKYILKKFFKYLSISIRIPSSCENLRPLIHVWGIIIRRGSVSVIIFIPVVHVFYCYGASSAENTITSLGEILQTIWVKNTLVIFRIKAFVFHHSISRLSSNCSASINSA